MNEENPPALDIYEMKSLLGLVTYFNSAVPVQGQERLWVTLLTTFDATKYLSCCSILMRQVNCFKFVSHDLMSFIQK